jgi:hypothetical protein
MDHQYSPYITGNYERFKSTAESKGQTMNCGGWE